MSNIFEATEKSILDRRTDENDYECDVNQQESDNKQLMGFHYLFSSGINARTESPWKTF